MIQEILIDPVFLCVLLIISLYWGFRFYRLQGQGQRPSDLHLDRILDRQGVGYVDSKGRDILCLAALEGETKVMVSALSQGADPNRLYDGTPLLSILATDPAVDIAAALTLLKGGALPDGPPGTWISPLSQCAMTDHIDLARLLLEYGADPNLQEPKTGATALMTAVSHGAVHVGQALIKAGADLHLMDQKGRTALAHAVINGTRSAKPKTLSHGYSEFLRQISCLMKGKPYVRREEKGISPSKGS